MMTYNEVDNDNIHDWYKVEDIMYRSNSHSTKRKPKVIRRNITDSILPSKEELIFGILLPTIRRSIRSKLYES